MFLWKHNNNKTPEQRIVNLEFEIEEILPWFFYDSEIVKCMFNF